jgi:membrane associated rhomboid family serine protease
VGIGEPEDRPPGAPKPPHDNLLGVRNRIIVGVVFAALYIATFGARTGWVAAIVSGVLGGIVFFMLLREVDERRRRKRR